MTWRHRLHLCFGPGILGGVTLRDWWALLRDNRFAVDPAYWPRAAAITLGSLGNSLARRREEAAHGRAVGETEVAPPLFVLGVWRSGTTHLQNLLAVDDRFAFLNWYQTSYPHTFLSTESTAARLARFFVPRTRIQDNMRLGLPLPAEDELALCTATVRSFMLSWVFPRRAEYYDRYLTLRGVPDDDLDEWKTALLWVVKKITLKYGKPVILKSPAHTGRIRLLLDMFPGARFVHIHRDPYTVFQSSCHTTRSAMRYCTLQNTNLDVEGRAIRQYNELVAAFFDEKDLIPKGRLHEVRFEDLERDPIGQMRRVYEALELPEFGVVEPAVRRYVDSLSAYGKNDYPDLAPELRARVAREWRRAFEAWDYPI